MNQLNKTLRDEAISLGLCQQWQNDWTANKNQGQLIEMFKRGIDFCIEHKFPSCEWIISNFDRTELRYRNVYIGEKDVKATVQKGVVVVRESTAEIFVERNAVVTVYCQDCPNVKIVAGKDSSVFIHLYDSVCECDATAKYSVVKSYSHGEYSKYFEKK